MRICAMTPQILSQFRTVTCLFNWLNALVVSTKIIASISPAQRCSIACDAIGEDRMEVTLNYVGTQEDIGVWGLRVWMFRFEPRIDRWIALRSLRIAAISPFSHCDVIVFQRISGYLGSHSQSVVVNGESSLPAPFNSGVPQGSVLGPFFYWSILMILLRSISEIAPKQPCTQMMSYCFDHRITWKVC